MQFRSRLRTGSHLIDLTPLVDVIFLLLIFFMLTADILPLKSLNVENPQLDRDSAPLTSQLIVSMDAQNVIYVGHRKEIIDLGDFKDYLRHEFEMIQSEHPENEPTIVLSVDRRVEYGAFLRLFSLAQECSPRVRLVYKPLDGEQFTAWEE
jgi:biopolymer transport protein ExbD